MRNTQRTYWLYYYSFQKIYWGYQQAVLSIGVGGGDSWHKNIPVYDPLFH